MTEGCGVGVALLPAMIATRPKARHHPPDTRHEHASLTAAGMCRVQAARASRGRGRVRGRRGRVVWVRHGDVCM
eukprot:361515-Chlamydomonas_euryale.AAC.1